MPFFLACLVYFAFASLASSLSLYANAARNMLSFCSVLLGVDKSQARRGRDLRKSVLRLRLCPASLHKREN